MAKKRVRVRASSTASVPSNDGTTNPLQEVITMPSPAMVNDGGSEVVSENKYVDGHTSEEGISKEIPVLVVENGEAATQGVNGSATNPLQEEVTVPSLTTGKVEETEVASMVKNEDKHSSEEGINDEIAMLVMKNGEVSMEEEENAKASVYKEKFKMDETEGEFEDKGFDEPTSAEEKDDAQMELGGENLEVDDEEEDDEDEDEDDGEEEDGEEEEQMEIGEEETGEEGEKEEENVEETLLVEKAEEKMEDEGKKEEEIVEETLLVEKAEEKMEDEGKKEEEIVEETLLEAKSEEKMEGNSREVAKNRVRSRSKKIGTKVEEKPTSGKKMMVSTSEDKPGASSKEIVATVEGDKPKALSKKKAGAKAVDKPEASGKKKAPKRVKSMGLIFMCNSKTKPDCYQYKLLGLPASKKDLVQKIYKGMRLFLFDIDLRLMYGIYKAAGPGGYNIQPKAFDSAFPSQVRFTVIEDCLPLAEEKFKHILKDNYYAKKKFDCQLNAEQVKNLCKLFNASGRVSKLKKPKNVVGTETYPAADRARIGRPRVDRERLGQGGIRRKRLDSESLDLRPRVPRERLVQGRIKRKYRLDEESMDQDRIRRQILDEEGLDRDRIRQQREDEERLDRGRVRRQRLDEGGWDPRYHEHPIVYERERYASPLPPPSRAYDSSSRAYDSSFRAYDSSSRAYDSYDRIAESAMYLRDPVVDRRERVPVLEHHVGLPAAYHRDRRILDLDLRHPDAVAIRDPYTSYREHNPPPRVQAATYLPLASSAPEYHGLEEAPGYEYGSLRPLYRY